MADAANPITSILTRHLLDRRQLAKILSVEVRYVDLLEKHGRDVPIDVLQSLERWIVERRDWIGEDEKICSKT